VRLTSETGSFNEQILYHCYIATPSIKKAVEERTPNDVWLNDLSTRRRFQAYLSRHANTPQSALDWVRPLLQTLNWLRSNISLELSRLLVRPVPTGVNGLFDDIPSTVLCDAVRGYARSFHSIRSNLQEPYVNVSEKPVEFWLFAIACVTGNLDSFEKLAPQIRSVLQPASPDRALFRLVVVAAQHGNAEVIEHIVEHNARFLETDEGRDWCGDTLSNALCTAATHGHTNVIDLLWPLYYSVYQDRPEADHEKLRRQMLYRACQLGRSETAECILKSGKANVYDCQVFARHNVFQIAANNDHVDCIRALFRNIDRFSEAEEAQKEFTLCQATRCCLQYDELDMWLEFLPHFPIELAIIYSARIDGGLAAMHQMRGSLDLANLLSVHSALEIFHYAIIYDKIQNVEYLLNAGIQSISEYLDDLSAPALVSEVRKAIDILLQYRSDRNEKMNRLLYTRTSSVQQWIDLSLLESAQKRPGAYNEVCELIAASARERWIQYGEGPNFARSRCHCL
jgi:hypothetical protein